jgi:hypothetical protein
MSDWPAVPNFGEILAEHIGSVPQAGQPAFLAGLERSAAARYRSWAEELPDHASVLNGCAAREDEIAGLVADLFPISPEAQSAVDAALPPAVETYYRVFSAHPVLHQLFLQSEAELQGAQAWVGIASQAEDANTREILARCTALEEESSRAVKDLLAKIA